MDETEADPGGEEIPLFAPPGPAPETRVAWFVIGVALVVVVAGIGVVVAESHGHGVAGGPSALVTLAAPIFASILCAQNGLIYYETYFPISNIAGGLLTSEFSLEILTNTNVTIPPGGSAPAPVPNLPCTAAPPSGWYAILLNSNASALATFPLLEYGTGQGTWSNSTTSPQNIVQGEDFLFITVGDPTGSGNRLVSQGYGTSTVDLAGNTTFPPYQKP
ncbi:MAG: hypothetical protein WB947_05720 [Thermoplasmata archaeon]